MMEQFEDARIMPITEQGYRFSGLEFTRAHLDGALTLLFLEADHFDPPYVVLSEADHDKLLTEVEELIGYRNGRLTKYTNNLTGRLMDVFVRPLRDGTFYLGAYPSLELLLEHPYSHNPTT